MGNYVRTRPKTKKRESHTLQPPPSPYTDTTLQDQHIQRGHPILFGLLLFFALIEGCITAWLGEFLASWLRVDRQSADPVHSRKLQQVRCLHHDPARDTY